MGRNWRSLAKAPGPAPARGLRHAVAFRKRRQQQETKTWHERGEVWKTSVALEGRGRVEARGRGKQAQP